MYRPKRGLLLKNHCKTVLKFRPAPRLSFPPQHRLPRQFRFRQLPLRLRPSLPARRRSTLHHRPALPLPPPPWGRAWPNTTNTSPRSCACTSSTCSTKKAMRRSLPGFPKWKSTCFPMRHLNSCRTCLPCLKAWNAVWHVFTITNPKPCRLTTSTLNRRRIFLKILAAWYSSSSS